MVRFVLIVLLTLSATLAFPQDISRARSLIRGGKRVEGRAILSRLYLKAPDPKVRAGALYYLASSEPTLPGRIGRLKIFFKEFPQSPLLPDARLLLARSLATLGKRKEALSILLPGLSRDKGGESVFFAARLLVTEGQFSKALGLLANLLKMKDKFSDQAGVAYLRGYAYLHLKQKARAEKIFQNLLKKYRGSSWEAPAVLHIAEIHYQRKAYDLAGKWFRKLLKKYPNSLSSFQARSRLLLLSRMLPPAPVYEIQVAAFRDPRRAAKQKGILKKQGLSPFVFRYSVGGGHWYSVRVGRFLTRKKAEKRLRTLRARGIKGFIRKRTRNGEGD